jgi:tRNA(Ile)-lysidine synthase
VPEAIPARVAAFCARHRLLPPGAPVLAMVSGGADSTCLVHLLAALHDGPVRVVCVDHGLRPEGAAEAAGAVAAARALGLRARVEALGLPSGAGAPARAREARLACARRVAEEEGCARIAVGHTASDQAETVLLRLARGAGRTGALGMRPSSGDLIRPLLCLEGWETRRFCAERGLTVVDDPSNADPAFARARARAGLVPALEELHPGAVRRVAAFADLLADEADLLDDLLDAAWERCVEGDGLVVAALAAEPDPVQRLLVRRLVREAGLPADAADTGAVERALALARTAGADGGAGPEAVPGGLLAVERGRLVAERAGGPPPAAAALAVPGSARFGEAMIVAEAGPAVPPTARRVAVAAELAARGLVVRGPAPGDRIALAGGGHASVGRLLAAAGIPARRRGRVPVVAAGERVLWVAGHRASSDALAAEGRPAALLRLAEAPDG